MARRREIDSEEWTNAGIDVGHEEVEPVESAQALL